VPCEYANDLPTGRMRLQARRGRNVTSQLPISRAFSFFPPPADLAGIHSTADQATPLAEPTAIGHAATYVWTPRDNDEYAPFANAADEATYYVNIEAAALAIIDAQPTTPPADPLGAPR